MDELTDPNESDPVIAAHDPKPSKRGGQHLNSGSGLSIQDRLFAQYAPSLSFLQTHC